MSGSLRSFALVAMLIASFSAPAQTTFPQWSWNGGPWLYSITAACAAFEAHQEAAYAGWLTLEMVGTFQSAENPDGHPAYVRYNANYISNGELYGPENCSPAHRHVTEPPPAEQCSKNPAHGVGQTFTSNHYPGADGYCHALSKCMMQVTSSTSVGGQTVYTVTHTDQSCAHGQVPPPGEDDLSDGETCAGSGAVQFCSSEQGSANCGFINGEYACLGSVEDDGCAVMPSGARACGASAPTPPVPDNGTPGQPADPDGQITINEGDTINYYNSSTVGGSNRPVNSGGDNPTDGRDDGNGAGRNEGDEEADGQDCEGSQCDFSGPELPEGDSFGAIGSAFIAEATATPIMGALTGISASVGTGECPTATFEVFGVEQTLDPMCDVWPSIAGVLSSVMLVIYGLGGVRILFSA